MIESLVFVFVVTGAAVGTFAIFGHLAMAAFDRFFVGPKLD